MTVVSVCLGWFGLVWSRHDICGDNAEQERQRRSCGAVSMLVLLAWHMDVDLPLTSACIPNRDNKGLVLSELN
jgi:hypothetical protein